MAVGFVAAAVLATGIVLARNHRTESTSRSEQDDVPPGETVRSDIELEAIRAAGY